MLSLLSFCVPSFLERRTSLICIDWLVDRGSGALYTRTHTISALFSPFPFLSFSFLKLSITSRILLCFTHPFCYDLPLVPVPLIFDSRFLSVLLWITIRFLLPLLLLLMLLLFCCCSLLLLVAATAALSFRSRSQF